MRYPGEWKFPGGVVDEEDKTLKDTAIRELEEEFLGVSVPQESAQIDFFGAKLTRPIQRRRHRMFNFVAFEDDNLTWLNDDVVRIVNESLAMKREEFDRYVESGRYWQMSEQEKMAVSPEIRRVAWFPIDQVIEMMSASISDPHRPLDDWQGRQFRLHNVSQRDPMYISMVILQGIRAFETCDALRAFVKEQVPPSLEQLAQTSSL
ncbi:hypothetical protein PINS_up023380 [Pythium insidiosum]|nr:hypothetical protein PINS_up023380 [Pythium insidiosum]